MDKWDHKAIRKAINDMITATGQRTMPTHTEIRSYYGNYALSNAIRRNGGTHYWAEQMGLRIKDCESKTGEIYERLFCKDLHDNTGLTGEQMPIRYPYDILVSGAVKVDIKASHMYRKDGYGFYTCNLSKKYPTCDVYVVYCLTDNSDVEKIYIIPSARLDGIAQLSIGEHRSKYDIYQDKWEIIEQYAKLMRQKYEQHTEAKNT